VNNRLSPYQCPKKRHRKRGGGEKHTQKQRKKNKHNSLTHRNQGLEKRHVNYKMELQKFGGDTKKETSNTRGMGGIVGVRQGRTENVRLAKLDPL